MPVQIRPHDPAWAQAFSAEAAALTAALRPGTVHLHHIGSTAVAGLLAKPIIDLLGAAPDLAQIDAQTPAFADLGYEAMGAYGIPGRRYFRKIDARGTRTHHVHVFETGSPHITRHLAFRDYLRAHPAEAAAYGALKTQLAAADGAGQDTSWDSYVDGKAPFVEVTEPKALAWYARRPQDPQNRP